MHIDDVRRRLIESGQTLSPAALANLLWTDLAQTNDPARAPYLANTLHADILGAGPLQQLLTEPGVTDVLVNGIHEVWIDGQNGLKRVEIHLGDEIELRRLAQRLATQCGRRLDDAQPWVDARLPDGTRLHAILPPLATSGVYLSLRTFPAQALKLTELVAGGTIVNEAVDLIRAILATRLSFLITGGTASGKTTLLATLLGEIDPHERIIVVEDAAELRPEHPHILGLQARTPNADGAGEVNLTMLVRQALRMRPDRIVIGECRGPEVVELLAALNTGHDGGAGTLHANSPADVPARLEALAALAGLNRSALHSQLKAALHCVLHMRRTPEGRVLDEIAVLRSDQHTVTAATAWSARLGPASALPELMALIHQRSVT